MRSKFFCLTQGHVAIIDAANYCSLIKHKWFFRPDGYAARNSTKIVNGKRVRTIVLMHRTLLRAPEGALVDHVNGNKLDNRIQNLRLCNASQNILNAPPRTDNTSGFKGVHCVTRAGHKAWVARIQVGLSRKYLGRFASAAEAAREYDKAAKAIFKDFAWLNFPTREAA